MDRTLVVDDSPTLRRMVIASLRQECTGGFAEAASGLEALEQLALGPVSLMVLDLNMLAEDKNLTPQQKTQRNLIRDFLILAKEAAGDEPRKMPEAAQ